MTTWTDDISDLVLSEKKYILRNPMSIVNVPAILGGITHFRRRWYKWNGTPLRYIYIYHVQFNITTTSCAPPQRPQVSPSLEYVRFYSSTVSIASTASLRPSSSPEEVHHVRQNERLGKEPPKPMDSARLCLLEFFLGDGKKLLGRFCSKIWCIPTKQCGDGMVSPKNRGIPPRLTKDAVDPSAFAPESDPHPWNCPYHIQDISTIWANY
jgi:hypothetical protein